jgi:hypothetical protein
MPSPGDERRRRRRQEAAAELRELADRIERGDFPDPGAVVDLARRVERIAKEHRPAARPGDRSKQVRALAKRLSTVTGVEVSTLYDPGSKRGGRVGAYALEWSNGPTVESMRAEAGRQAKGLPAVDVDLLRFRRGCAPRVEAACLIRHLDDHPDAANDHAERRTAYGRLQYNRLDQLAASIAAGVDYPERLLGDETVRRRFEAFKALDPHRTQDHEPSVDAWLALGDRILRFGWPATRDFLDEMAARPVVPDELAQRRARSRHNRNR